MWLFFDDRNIYVSARCWDSQPDRQIANEMRRDGQGTNDNESFGVVFDTFHDGRNGFLFQTTLAGGLFDGYITDERDMNRDWNTVWDARSDRTEDGYAVEMVIPFKSLRFKAGEHAGVGRQFQAGHPVEERAHLPDAHSRGARTPRHQQDLVGGHAGRHRNAAERAQRRVEALRHLGTDHAPAERRLGRERSPTPTPDST